MLGSNPPRHTSVATLIKAAFGRSVVWPAVMAVVFALVVQWSCMPDKERLTIGYQAPGYQVWTDSKPRDCDFSSAPLGNKQCRYEKVVDVERACNAPDCKVTVVRETWHKIELGTLDGRVFAISAEVLPVRMAQGHLIPCEQPKTVAANACDYFRQALQAQVDHSCSSASPRPIANANLCPTANTQPRKPLS